MFSRLSFMLNYRKSNGPMRRAFTREVSKCLFNSAYDVSHVSLYGVQLLSKVGIMMSTFFVFHVSLLKSSVVNSVDLGFLGTYIPTCICTQDI